MSLSRMRIVRIYRAFVKSHAIEPAEPSQNLRTPRFVFTRMITNNRVPYKVGPQATARQQTYRLECAKSRAGPFDHLQSTHNEHQCRRQDPDDIALEQNL